MTALRRSILTALAGAVAAALLFSLATAYDARATHEPANKGAAAGSDIDQVNETTPLLSETMRVSSQEDVIIAVTAECSILTNVRVNNNNPVSSALGSVRLWVTIDGKRVPVADDDKTQDTDDEVQDPNDESDVGEVTFCNRYHEREVMDRENPADGVDAHRDFLRTRAANGFNWLALDTGFLYDDAVTQNGNNILEVILWADFDEANTGHPLGFAEAFVGSRTMIIEPIRLSIHEQVAPQGGVGN